MLITNGTVITWDDGAPLIADGAVWLRDGRVAAVGPAAQVAAEADRAGQPVERVDARGGLIMPGLVCAHTHFYGAYARGMAISGPAPADFPAILRQLWWKLDRALDRDAVRLSAAVSLLDAVRGGTTTLIDHHASPSALSGSLDVIAAEVERFGLRAALAYEVTDRNGPAEAEAGIAENIAFMSRHNNASHAQSGAVRGLFGLHASLTLSDSTLRRAVDAASQIGSRAFHIHAGEHEADGEDSRARFGLGVIERLDRFGIVNSESIIAHAVHVSPGEIAMLAERGAWVSHQPRSNMNNAVGAMPWAALHAAGARVVLGNDGFSNAMWDEWKAAYFLHKAAHRDPREANGADVVAAGTARNADLATHVFGLPVGRLVVGAAADVIIADYQPFTPMTAGNLPWHFLFGIGPASITTTIAGGRVLMRDRALVGLDERAILREALAHAPGVWARYAALADA